MFIKRFIGSTHTFAIWLHSIILGFVDNEKAVEQKKGKSAQNRVALSNAASEQVGEKCLVGIIKEELKSCVFDT